MDSLFGDPLPTEDKKNIWGEEELIGDLIEIRKKSTRKKFRKKGIEDDSGRKWWRHQETSKRGRELKGKLVEEKKNQNDFKERKEVKGQVEGNHKEIKTDRKEETTKPNCWGKQRHQKWNSRRRD